MKNRFLWILLVLSAGALACSLTSPAVPSASITPAQGSPSPAATLAAVYPSPTPARRYAPTIARIPTRVPSATVVPIPIPDLDIPTPAPGLAALAGRVMWNSQPVADAEVRLCLSRGLSLFFEKEGCPGRQITRSDARGMYVFNNLAPDTYSVLARGLAGEDDWFHFVGGSDFPQSDVFIMYEYVAIFDLTPGQALALPDLNLYKRDLAVAAPLNGDIFRRPPDLTWQPYPGATTYGVTVNHASELTTAETRLPLPPPFEDGTVRWSVAAYNAAGIRIAQSRTLQGLHLICQSAACQPDSGPSFTGQNPMITIPAGAFEMGGRRCMGITGGRCWNFQPIPDSPYHTVTLDAFAIDVYEVTVEQYFACVAAGMCPPWGFSPQDKQGSFLSYPVTSVSWYMADAYCSWLGKRLPSEAEWEKAARGGRHDQLYPWGDNHPVCAPGVANGARSANCDSTDPHPVDVGTYAPNAYGLYDVLGNAAEWVSDWYDPEYYPTSPAANPSGPTHGDQKVYRGGSYADRVGINYIGRLFIGTRASLEPKFGLPNIGFRCAATSP